MTRTILVAAGKQLGELLAFGLALLALLWSSSDMSDSTWLSLQSSREEDGHGSLRWSGRSPDELHLRGDGTVGQAAEVDGGGDERSGGWWRR